MTVSGNETLGQLIHWRQSFDTCITLINEQHQGILNFINHWYEQLKQKDQIENLSRFANQKFGFLIDFSKGHLRFESELLRLLKDEYGFAPEKFERHMEAHRWFMQSFLMPLTKQLATGIDHQNEALLEDVALGGLSDTAHWWYNHIRTPKEGEEPGPDHIYRTYLESLPLDARLEIVNQMAVYLARASKTFWPQETGPGQA